MRNVKVSVVVPVYNAEKYLKQCVESLVGQSFHDIEYIFVDDGSNDSSLKILERYKASDDRITIIHQCNQYAGAARNAGLKIASGKYIMFLDADDFFDHDMVRKLYLCAEKRKAEVVVFGNYTYDATSQKIEKSPFQMKKSGWISSETCGADFFCIARPVPWNKFILRELALKHEINYQHLLNSNDMYFNRIIVSVSNSIFYLRKRFVYYRINNSASLQGTINKNLLCFIDALSKTKAEMERRGVFEGQLKKAYDKEAKSLIIRQVEKACSLGELKTLSAALQERISELFASSGDWMDNEVIRSLLCSEQIEEFLFFLSKHYKKEKAGLVSKTAKEYRAGEFLLYIPKIIYNSFAE